MGFFSHAIGRPDESLLAMMASIGGQIRQFIERKQAAVALRKEREFLRAVLENAHDGIVACDSEGTLTFFNGATRAFHGIPVERLPGLQKPFTPGALEQKVRKMLDRQKPWVLNGSPLSGSAMARPSARTCLTQRFFRGNHGGTPTPFPWTEHFPCRLE